MFSKKKIIYLLLTLIIILSSSINLVIASDINATISVFISKPSAPFNLAATVGDKNIDLSWSIPSSDGGAAIFDYIVEYKLTNGGSWAIFPDGISTNPTANVINLSNDNSYDFRVSAVNSIGQGSVSSEISAAPGSPAEVIVLGMSDLTITSIAANVRITNEGLTAYEYQYTWCVTDSDINLCGGGDDIFSSTAAKLIQSGESFDTTLTSIVSHKGNYWFHINAQFGSDSSNASQSFTAVSDSAPSSNGGGGGGGSSKQKNDYCVGADFNKDGKVNSIDFSILLAFWRTKSPFKNSCVDINRDDQVNSVDFSIMLYQWNKKPISFK